MTPGERKEFIADIAAAIQLQVPVASFDADEVTALKLLIKKQEQNIKLRQAVIDKSLTALVWAGLVGLAMIGREYAVNHGMWKP
jgi:hypothetical protein